MKPILQSEASECGLACLAMVLGHHGHHVELLDLRRQFSVSLKGTRLSQLVRHAEAKQFAARPVRLELEELEHLRLPAILHWNQDHFVVLAKVGRTASGKRAATILDPAVGKVTLALAEVSKCFTGVALELVPTEAFEQAKPSQRVTLAALAGRIGGLLPAAGQLIAMAAALEIFALVTPLFNQYVIDNVIVSGDHQLLKILAIGFGLLLVAQTGIDVARSWFLMRWSMDISTQWATRVLRHMVRLPSEYFEKRHVGDIVSRFASVTAIQKTLSTVILGTILDGIMAAAALVVMFLYSVQLAAVVLAAGLLYCLLRWAAFAPFRNASNEGLILAAKESTHFLETVRAIVPVKLFGRENERVSRWLSLRESVNNREVRTQKLAIAFRISATVISGARTIIVFYLGARLVMAQELTVGMLMAFATYSTTFLSRFIALADAFVNVKLLAVHTERLADIVLEPAEAAVGETAAPDPAEIPAEISLRNVRFRYADGEPWVLDGISLDIHAGDHLAITGPSGSGKTTLVKIALGLLAPTEGEVLIGGRPLDQVGKSAYRRIVGTVMQDDTLLTGTLYDNICFFDVDANPAAVTEAAVQASIHHDIAVMPMGYQTLVGDMGSALSGGQKQRVLLARALYKRPKVLALDEATSHLDLINEKLITERLDALQVTRIIVAHRPETVANAERVIFVARGKLQVIDDGRNRKTPGDSMLDKVLAG